MSEICSHRDVQACGGAIRHRCPSDQLLMVAVLLTLVRLSDAQAAEQSSIAGGALKPDFNAAPERSSVMVPMLALPANYQLAEPPERDMFSPHNFRPRGVSGVEPEARFAAPDEAPMLRSTTVWQRLAEYRSHGRVRLLTLWEGGGSTVSLQAGKKGEPSLQWTSRLMNRGGATRGVLDQLLSVSVARASRGLHMAPHAPATEPAGKPTKPSEVAIGGTK